MKVKENKNKGEIIVKNKWELNDILTEEDFYPPSDDRMLTSYIEDMKDEVSFVEYAKYIYDLYEEEGYYEN